jgi:aminomethyltransferase
MPIGTPLHNRTSSLNENHEWRDWSGYLAAGTYEPSFEREYYAIRNAAALIDISPLYKYDITGPESNLLVDKIITRDISKCAKGQIFYSPWCDETGHIIDDGTIWHIADNHFRITSADPSQRWFQDCGFGLEAEVRNISASVAALAIQGPNSRKILKKIGANIDLEKLGYFRLVEANMKGIPVTITRTGFTGDLGYELWVSPGYALQMWDLLIAAGEGYGLLPAGMVALDIARIEAGLLLIDVDYVSAAKALTNARKSTPFEVGLGWTVNLDKELFVGKQALVIEKKNRSKWAFAGLEIDWEALEKLFAAHDLPPMVAGRATRDPVPIYNSRGRQVGQATSRTFSPIQKRYIALATLEKEYAQPGTALRVEVTVEYTRQQCPAVTVELPFYDPTHKRK